MELKPCPFCGNKHVRIVDNHGWWCTCDSCDSLGPFKASIEEAITAWNTRYKEVLTNE